MFSLATCVKKIVSTVEKISSQFINKFVFSKRMVTGYSMAASGNSNVVQFRATFIRLECDN